MKFESRLLKPVVVTESSVSFFRNGQAMVADCYEPITISVETPVEICECECGKHPCASFKMMMTDGTEALVTANLPEGSTAIRFSR